MRLHRTRRITVATLYVSSFEDEFERYNDDGHLTVPSGWVPVWKPTDGTHYLRPEWKPELDRVRTGEQAAKFASRHSNQEAALMRVVPLNSDAPVTFTAHGATYSDPAGHALRIGIDPTGQGRFPSDRIVFSDWWGQDNPDWQAEQYHQFRLSVTPQRNQVAVYLYGFSRFAAPNVVAYWDDVEITQAGSEPGPGGDVDYERIRAIVREELAEREPVRWPR